MCNIILILVTALFDVILFANVSDAECTVQLLVTPRILFANVTVAKSHCSVIFY
jgi:hypothetical protein